MNRSPGTSIVAVSRESLRPALPEACFCGLTVYLQGDTNAAPTGGTCQVQYQLKAGEARWQLVPDKVIDF